MSSDQEVAFPVFSAGDLAALTARSHSREVRACEILFAEGDRDFCFFVVLEGAVEIVEHSSGAPLPVTVHRPGEFTGDVDMLTGRSALVTARATEDGRLLQLSTEELRRNAILFTWIDLDSDEQADALLRQFGIRASATPILIGRDGRWVSNPSIAEFARCVGLETTLEADRVYDLIVVGAGPAGLAGTITNLSTRSYGAFSPGRTGAGAT